MYRYSMSSSNRKGQFFIIAAVIIVSVLFSIYAVYLGYYAVDTSLVQDFDSAYLLDNIESQTRTLHSEYENSPCSEIKDRFDSYKRFTERSGLESGNVINYDYNMHRGCLHTDFDLEMRTRDSKVSKDFTLSVPHTKRHWNMYNSDTFTSGTGYEIEPGSQNNIDISNSGLTLTSGSTSGSITYLFDFGETVTWYSHVSNNETPGDSNVTIRWYINESPCTDPGFCRINNFNELPDELRWLKQEIILERTNSAQPTPVLNSSNTTYATRP